MTRYTFDALNRLVTVLAPGGGLTTYAYDRSSLKRTVDYPNGTRSRHSYDQARRTLELTHTQGAALIAAYSYGYDANGNRTRQLETNGGSAEETTYSFDATDRLTQVVYPDATVSYTYDAAYNRTGERAVDNTTSAVLTDKGYGYNARNQLTQVTNNQDAAQNVTYQFDANGNQTLKSQNGTITTFVYDVRDKLIAVRQDATTLGQFRYDHAGMRIKKTTQEGEVRYSYDGDSVLAQYDQTGQTLAKYEYGPDQLLSLNHQAEGRQYYHFDALGSVASLTKPDASIQARYQYDAWGNERQSAGASFNRFGYTGHEKDAETGLYYFKARFYDPETGRFLSQDSYLGDVNTAPSLHRYLYAYANPTVYVDLDGYESILLPHDLHAMEETAADDSILWAPAHVSDESSRFVKAAGGSAYSGAGGWAVGKPAAQQVSAKVRSVVGDQDGAAALVVEEGDTLNTIVRHMDQQLGTRWHRSGGKSLLEKRLAGAQPGDIIDISNLYRAAYNDTLKANDSELQGFARDQRETAAATSFGDTPDVHINAVSASVAAEMQRTWRIANDPNAPELMRREARQAVTEGAVLALLPLKAMPKAARGAPEMRVGGETERTLKPFYRYVGEGEAEAIRRTGTIPNVDRAGNLKDVYFTDRLYKTAGRAKTHNQLPNKPAYRVEIDPANVKERTPFTRVNPSDNPQWGSGGGMEATTRNPIVVDPDTLVRLKGAPK